MYRTYFAGVSPAPILSGIIEYNVVYRTVELQFKQSLQFKQFGVILSPYHSEYGREENRACYDRRGKRGVLHAGRGSRNAHYRAGKCGPLVTSGEDAGIQVWGFLAYRQARVCTVSGSSEKQIPVRSGKLTDISLSAADRLGSSDSTPTEPNPRMSCCLLLLCHKKRGCATLRTINNIGSVQTKESEMNAMPMNLISLALDDVPAPAPALFRIMAPVHPRCRQCGLPAYHDINLCYDHLRIVTLLDRQYARWVRSGGGEK